MTSQKLIADYGKNEIGIRIGYFKPKGYEAYFPVQSEATEEYLHYDNAIININYNRKINSGFDVGVDLGFTGVLDNSDHNTILNSFPLGIYAVTKIISLYGLECYGGGGLNFWYMETKKGDTQGLSGYHLRLNLKFQVFRVELDYSTINDFGAEDKDIGGWSIKIGAAFTFSYH
ncbi:hypothetical protein KJ966_07720 [bacterium]|nr:hypothetical protein [bacterium]